MKLVVFFMGVLAVSGLRAGEGADASGGGGVSEGERRVILQLTSIFENSTTELCYGYCENIGDGRGFTFGFAGFTSGTFDGGEVIREYVRLRPVEGAGGNALARFLPAFEAIDRGRHDSEGRNGDTRGLEGFAAAVKACGDDALFRQAQHVVADRLYWRPSQEAAERLGAKFAITRGELYDAFINHGEDGALKIARAATRSAGGTPGDGVEERKWLAAFLEARMGVLKADKTWAESVDRVRVYQKILASGNVGLKLPIEVVCYGDRFVVK